jgi:D-amino-acid oxidase
MHITILGCGVIGLTTALRLQEAGHGITIKTWKIPPETTSDKAAAFWSPYRIGENAQTFEWIRDTYGVLEELSRIPGSGVSMIPLRKFLKDPLDQSDRWWLMAVPEGRHAPLPPAALPPGYASGWTAEVPLMETPLYLPFLLERLVRSGAALHTGEHITDLPALLSPGTAVINCTGLGSRELCGDKSLVPIRGQIAVTRPFSAGAIYVDAETPTYIVPREDGCIIGGTYEQDVWEEVPDPGTIRTLLERAPNLVPGLDTGPAVRAYAGLRPYRTSVRLEADPDYPGLIHHYGHGGAGFTLSWGAAASVVRLVSRMA